jgi:hypothetical protein
MQAALFQVVVVRGEDECLLQGPLSNRQQALTCVCVGGGVGGGAWGRMSLARKPRNDD